MFVSLLFPCSADSPGSNINVMPKYRSACISDAIYGNVIPDTDSTINPTKDAALDCGITTSTGTSRRPGAYKNFSYRITVESPKAFTGHPSFFSYGTSGATTATSCYRCKLSQIPILYIIIPLFRFLVWCYFASNTS